MGNKTDIQERYLTVSEQIGQGLDDDPREAARPRVIWRDLPGPLPMRPAPDGGICAVPTVLTRVRLK
jgi:hypothetical protein